MKFFLDEPVTAGEAVDDLGLEPGAEDEGEYEGDGGGHQDHNHPILNTVYCLINRINNKYVIEPKVTDHHKICLSDSFMSFDSMRAPFVFSICVRFVCGGFGWGRVSNFYTFRITENWLQMARAWYCNYFVVLTNVKKCDSIGVKMSKWKPCGAEKFWKTMEINRDHALKTCLQSTLWSKTQRRASKHN